MFRPRFAVAAAVAGSALAALAAGAETGDPVVARVGAVEIRASDAARRLDAVPDFQLRALGSPADARRRVVDGVLVRDALLGGEAERRGLRREPGVRRRIDAALERALVDDLRRRIQTAGIPDAEIASYYDAHEGDYEQPERLRISRILVPDEAAARHVLAEARAKPGAETWNRLARELSVDPATKIRGGQLGFVHPNGHTDVPQLEVDPALYAAAAKVKDGEIVPEPVKEKERFAVVWRRGTLPAVRRSLADERERITGILVQVRLEAELRKLVADLRKREVHEIRPELLESLPPDLGKPFAAPGSAPPPPPGSAAPAPRASERGLR